MDRLSAGLKTCGGPKTRGRSPLCIVGFYDTAGEVLLKREPTGSPGVRGNPGSPFAHFWGSGQKWVARRPNPFNKLWFLCTYAAIKHRCALAPPFFPQRKGGKKRQGTKPPEPPGGLQTFFSGKSAGGRTPEPAHTMREPRGPRGPVGRGTETIQRPKALGRSPLCIARSGGRGDGTTSPFIDQAWYLAGLIIRSSRFSSRAMRTVAAVPPRARPS